MYTHSHAQPPHVQVRPVSGGAQTEITRGPSTRADKDGKRSGGLNTRALAGVPRFCAAFLYLLSTTRAALYSRYVDSSSAERPRSSCVDRCSKTGLGENGNFASPSSSSDSPKPSPSPPVFLSGDSMGDSSGSSAPDGPALASVCFIASSKNILQERSQGRKGGGALSEPRWAFPMDLRFTQTCVAISHSISAASDGLSSRVATRPLACGLLRKTGFFGTHRRRSARTHQKPPLDAWAGTCDPHPLRPLCRSKVRLLCGPWTGFVVCDRMIGSKVAGQLKWAMS